MSGMRVVADSAEEAETVQARRAIESVAHAARRKRHRELGRPRQPPKEQAAPSDGISAPGGPPMRGQFCTQADTATYFISTKEARSRS